MNYNFNMSRLSSASFTRLTPKQKEEQIEKNVPKPPTSTPTPTPSTPSSNTKVTTETLLANKGINLHRGAEPTYGTVTLCNGTKGTTMTQAQWLKAGVPNVLINKCFTNVKLNGAPEYGLNSLYTDLNEVGSGSDKNGSYKIFTASMNDGKNGEVHSQQIKAYDDGTISVEDAYTKTYPTSNGSPAILDKKSLKDLGLSDDMIKKYFKTNANGDYILQSPYTSFEITRFEGDTNKSSQITFINNGKNKAMNDTYIYDKNGNDISPREERATSEINTIRNPKKNSTPSTGTGFNRFGLY